MIVLAHQNLVTLPLDATLPLFLAMTVMHVLRMDVALNLVALTPQLNAMTKITVPLIFVIQKVDVHMKFLNANTEMPVIL